MKKLKDIQIGEVFRIVGDPPELYFRIHHSKSYDFLNVVSQRTCRSRFIHPDTNVEVVGQLVVIPLEDVKNFPHSP